MKIVTSMCCCAVLSCTVLNHNVFSQALVAVEQLRYTGSFDIPESGNWQQPPKERLDYSMGTIGYREDCDALYVVSHAQDPTAVALIAVPESITLDAIPIAQQLKPMIALPAIADKQVSLRGLHWDNPTQTLYYNYTVWYNVSGEDAAGLGAVRNGKTYGLWFASHNNSSAGYITRDTLSGKLIVGSAVAQGIATSSLGPSAFRLNLHEDKLPEPNERIVTQTMLFYPGRETDTRRKAVLSTGDPWWDGMEVYGGACVDGTLIVAVDEGERSFYGTPDEFRSEFGFPPRSGGKGYHNDPHRAMLWFYSLEELHRKEIGTLTSVEVAPYACLRIDALPARGWLGGLAYDPKLRRLFVSQSRANAAMTPRIHVYQILD